MSSSFLKFLKKIFPPFIINLIEWISVLSFLSCCCLLPNQVSGVSFPKGRILRSVLI